MDTRLIVIAAPLLIAGSWALFNIGRLLNPTSSTFNTLRFVIKIDKRRVVEKNN
jgi:hypothetical protein